MPNVSITSTMPRQRFFSSGSTAAPQQGRGVAGVAPIYPVEQPTAQSYLRRAATDRIANEQDANDYAARTAAFNALTAEQKAQYMPKEGESTGVLFGSNGVTQSYDATDNSEGIARENFRYSAAGRAVTAPQTMRQKLALSALGTGETPMTEKERVATIQGKARVDAAGVTAAARVKPLTEQFADIIKATQPIVNRAATSFNTWMKTRSAERIAAGNNQTKTDIAGTPKPVTDLQRAQTENVQARTAKLKADGMSDTQIKTLMDLNAGYEQTDIAEKSADGKTTYRKPTPGEVEAHMTGLKAQMKALKGGGAAQQTGDWWGKPPPGGVGSGGGAMPPGTTPATATQPTGAAPASQPAPRQGPYQGGENAHLGTNLVPHDPKEEYPDGHMGVNAKGQQLRYNAQAGKWELADATQFQRGRGPVANVGGQ